MNKMTEAIEINHKELKQFIDNVYGTKISLNLIGTVGIGKSVAVYEKAKELAEQEKREFVDWNRSNEDVRMDAVKNPNKYFIFLDIRLSQYDATDLKGVPNINGKEAFLQWMKERWIHILSNEGVKGIVFFDEMNLAPPSVLASAYQFIRDRCVGDTKIADNICIISAGNRLEDMANVYDMPKPLCNRFIHATLLPPDIDSWTDWAMDNGVDTRVITYLNYKNGDLFKFSPDSPESAFPTPRAWAEYVSPLIKDKSHSSPLFQKLVASAIGTGIAVEFCAFLSLQDTIDFDKILKNPQEIENITKVSMQYSLVGLITDWLVKNHDKAGIEKLAEMLSYQQPEFAIITLKHAIKAHKVSVKRYLPSSKVWKEALSDEYYKYLQG